MVPLSNVLAIGSAAAMLGIPGQATGLARPILRKAGPRPATTRPIGCVSRGTSSRRNGWRGRHAVALTFDDGPWSDTPAVVSVLERYRVPATFFLIGRQVPGHGPLLRRELRDGDALGNHTFTHPDLVRAGGVGTQLGYANTAIERASGGYRPCVFRPPYGSVNPAVIRTARQFGLSTILWDVDPTDWAQPGTQTIIRRVLSSVRNGSIVIMHDGGGVRGQTLAALAPIIRGLRARHFKFQTVPDLLGYRTLRSRGPLGLPADRGQLGSMIPPASPRRSPAAIAR